MGSCPKRNDAATFVAEHFCCDIHLAHFVDFILGKCYHIQAVSNAMRHGRVVARSFMFVFKKTKIIVALCIVIVLCLASATTIIIVCGNDDAQVQFSPTLGGKVNQWSQTIGTVSRNIPQTTSNEGLCERYPTYGTALKDVTDEEKDAILQENALIMASKTTYDAMDKDGNLLLNGQPIGKKLYKHTAAVGMYYGNVDDDEQAVVERITIAANEQRNFVTGLYAPAGEVVKVEISEEDLAAIGGSFTVVVGQVSHRNNVNNIWKARDDFSRMPVVANILEVTTTTAYVGNPLGGPVYVYPSAVGSTFTVTISGAVKYAYYVHGQTTAAQVEEMKKYSAPYYDFEVWDLGVRVSGPSAYGSYDYENLVKVGNLWEKIIRTSRQVPSSANPNIGVGFVCDCFVAAGAACAFQGGHSWVNMPCSWMSGALNYQNMVTDGFWGVIHEYNHLWQSYGMEGSKTNEVTNNATSLLTYVSYTKISEKRSENDNDLSGWNRYTDASRSLRETVEKAKSGEPQHALNAYADIIHAFGVELYAKATQLQQGGFEADNWYEALSLATDYNFTFYFEKMLNCTLSDEVKSLYDTADRITFVPVATVFQTGRSIVQNGKEVFVETMLPYLIERGASVEVDFNKRLILPDGVTFKIKGVTKPASGEFVKIAQNVYSYTAGKEEYSGAIKVRIELSSADFETQQVTLTLNFRQYDKNQVEVTKYLFDQQPYTTVAEAVENNFEGYATVENNYSSSTFLNGLSSGQIGVVSGKIYVEKSGNYAFCLRAGRGNNTLYLSVNDPNALQQVLSLSGNHPNWTVEGEQVVQLQLNAGDYVYFKEITLAQNTSDAYTELGMANLDETSTMSAVPTRILCTVDMQMPNVEFSSEELFPRKYETTEQLDVSDSSEHALVSVNMSSWDETTGIENIFDGNAATFYHNQRNNFVSEQNPFELVVDMGKIGTFNTIKILSRTSGQLNFPCTFRLTVSNDGESWREVGNFENLPISGNAVQASFATEQFRYYKLVVTDTKSATVVANKYVTISSIEFSHSFAGTELSPYFLDYYVSDKESFVEEWTESSFGKLIVGNGRAVGKFCGSGFALVVRQDCDCVLKISIDGKETVVELSQSDGKQIAFWSVLKSGEHKVQVEVVSGTLSVDSVIVQDS